MTGLVLLFAASVTTNLPTIVVEASRLDRTPLEMPSAVHVLGKSEIASSSAHSAVDLLAKEAPEIHIHHVGGGNPALSEISLRGYGENGHGRTLVLVDGERLNSADMNMPNLSRIALNGVSKIEILSGPQTVLQGDCASAGVINIQTEPQDDEKKTYLEAHVGSWGTVGASLGTRGGLSEEGVRYWADGSWDHSDGYRSQSGYDIWNVNGGVKKEWAGGTSLKVTGFYNDSQYELPGALSYREWQDDPQKSHASEDRFHRATYGFAATLKARMDEENDLKVTGNFSNRKMWAYQQGEGWFSDNEYDIYSYRVLAEWLNATTLFGLDNELVVGAQHAADLLDGMQRWQTSSQNPKQDRLSMDFYAQETLHFTEGLSLELGGRYSRIWARNSLCERERRNDHLGAFDVALVLNPTDESKIYLKESRHYRNPFLDEVPGRYDAGYNWVNTEILSPEAGWTTEVGASWNVTDDLTVGADAYCTWLTDEILYNSVTHNNENCEDDTLRRGIDAHVTWEREKLAGLSAGVSYVRATFDGGSFGRNAIPLVPEVTVSANGRVWLWDECWLFGGYRYQCSSYTCSDFNNEYERLPGYGIFHLGATYEPTVLAWMEGMKITFAIENLLDENYCDYAILGSQYYPGDGRSFSLSVRYEF